LRRAPGLLGAVAAACFALPATASAQTPAAGLDEAGRLNVDFTVDRFVMRNGRLHARGTAVARLSGVDGQTRTVRKRATAPVLIAQRGSRRCALIALSLVPLRLDMLGLRVETSTINLRISGIRRGEGAGVLGRVLCSLNNSRVRLRTASGARGREVAQLVDAQARHPRVPGHGHAAAAGGDQPGAEQLPGAVLQLGPLELSVLGLLVELFGENRRDPVTITVTAFRGGGVLGDLFCGLAGPAPPPS
jgi:hypothetical protein